MDGGATGPLDEVADDVLVDLGVVGGVERHVELPDHRRHLPLVRRDPSLARCSHFLTHPRHEHELHGDGVVDCIRRAVQRVEHLVLGEVVEELFDAGLAGAEVLELVGGALVADEGPIRLVVIRPHRSDLRANSILVYPLDVGGTLMDAGLLGGGVAGRRRAAALVGARPRRMSRCRRAAARAAARARARAV